MLNLGFCDGADLCEEFGLGDSSFMATYQGDPPHREIHTGPGIRLIADLSPLATGHLLLLPERHYLSFGHLVPDLAAEVKELVTRLLPLYCQTFGRVTVLEHGSSTGMHSACITHAHWHVVPLDGADVCRLVADDGLTRVRLNEFEDLHQFAIADQAYYYCFDGADNYVFRADRKVRSQYLRSVMGRVLGISDPLWDWSLVIRKELLRETMRRSASWREKLAPLDRTKIIDLDDESLVGHT